MNGQTAPVEVMASNYVCGKMPKDATQDQWREFNSSFKLYKTTARGLAIEIYHGHSFCPVFHGRRIKPNFQRAWHIALDFDTEDERSTVATLSEVDIVKQYASFVYTTPSHTDAKPRARVVWIFNEAVDELQFYELMFKALLWKLPFADQGAKDGLRLYFGSPKCNLLGIWNVIDLPTCNSIIDEYEANIQKPVPIERPIRINPDQVSDSFLQRKLETLLAKIVLAPDGVRHKTLLSVSILLGGFSQAGYYSLSDVQNNLLSAAEKNPSRNYDETIRYGLSLGAANPLYIERAGNIGDRNHG